MPPEQTPRHRPRASARLRRRPRTGERRERSPASARKGSRYRGGAVGDDGERLAPLLLLSVLLVLVLMLALALTTIHPPVHRNIQQ